MFRNLSPQALGISGRQSEIIELSLSYGFKGIDVDMVDFQQTVKASNLAHARRLIDSAAEIGFVSFAIGLGRRRRDV